MKLQFLNKQDKEQLLKELKEQFGIEELPFPILLYSGEQKDKILGFSGSFSEKEITNLWHLTQIENIGLYLFTREKDGLRLTLEAAHLLKDQIKKGIFEINTGLLGQWMSGADVQFLKKETEELNTKGFEKGFYIIKHKDDFLGTGKLSSLKDKISNFIPKERRLRVAVR